ncbi:MAG: hypothetical protein AAFN78_00900 [Pseudomonadota bacterium]
MKINLGTITVDAATRRAIGYEIAPDVRRRTATREEVREFAIAAIGVAVDSLKDSLDKAQELDASKPQKPATEEPNRTFSLGGQASTEGAGDD